MLQYFLILENWSVRICGHFLYHFWWFTFWVQSSHYYSCNSLTNAKSAAALAACPASLCSMSPPWMSMKSLPNLLTYQLPPNQDSNLRTSLHYPKSPEFLKVIDLIANKKKIILFMILTLVNICRMAMKKAFSVLTRQVFQ